MCKAKVEVKWAENDMEDADCFTVTSGGESFDVVLLDYGTAMCSCEFDAENATCGHVAAAKRYARSKKFLKLRSENVYGMLSESEEMSEWENS